MRKAILKLHLWLALGSSLVLLVVAATGCLLAFELTMDAWLDPGAFYVKAQGSPAPFATLTDRIHAAFPGRSITQVNLFGPGKSVEFRLSGALRAYLDPHTGELLGTRSGEPPSYWVRHVHRELAGGTIGVQIVRAASFIVLFQSLSGVWLWWPSKRWKVKLGASWRKVSFDLHHAVGLASSVFLCILAATGLVKSFGDELQPFLNRVTGEPAAVRTVGSRRSDAATIGFDRALVTATAILPGARPARITPPPKSTDPIVVTMKFPGDSTAPGRSWVVMDRSSGEVLATQDARSAPTAAMVPIVNRAIHVGGFAGVPSRILVFLVSLALLLQVVTGFVMWWKKRAACKIEVSSRGAAYSLSLRGSDGAG